MTASILAHGRHYYHRSYPATDNVPCEIAFIDMTVSRIAADDFYEDGQFVEWENVVDEETGKLFTLVGSIVRLEKALGGYDSDGSPLGPFVYTFCGDAYGEAE